MLDPSIQLTVARSERALTTAKLALEAGDPESATSRSYYALYHMTILLLRVVRGIERDRWDHDQLHKAFLDQFCKLGFRFDMDAGRDWGKVKDDRIHADYGRHPMNDRSAQRCVERAEKLIVRMKAEVGINAC